MFIDGVKTLLFWGKIRLGMAQKARSYRQVLENQRLSADELDELNWQKRKSILSYAYNHVPLYRRKYSEAGLHPDDIKLPQDFARVPVLTKDEIKENASELLSDEAEAMFMTESSTGGSTGAPVKVMHDRRFHYEPLLWRMLGWWGVTPEMNSAYVLRLRRKRPVERWINTAMWWPTRRALLDASLMRQEDIEKFVRILGRIRPKLLQGYAGSVYHLALFMEKRGLRIDSPKAVWVTSSPISKVQRLKIEDVFGAPVYDQYGCGEIFAIAAQCGVRDGLHVFHDARYVEFVDHNTNAVAEGEYGMVLITDLENRVFPIIRYQNGDMGRFLRRTCSCGLKLPLIDSIKGRISDFLRFPDGSTISGDYLTTIFDDFPDTVEAFQVRQEKDYSVRLIYVPSPNRQGTEEAIKHVRAELEKRCRLQAKVSVEKVDDISHDRGKLCFVFSEVG